MSDLLEVLTKARDLCSRGWTKSSYTYRDCDNTYYCAAGAVHAVMGRGFMTSSSRHVFDALADVIPDYSQVPTSPDTAESKLIKFNDYNYVIATVKADVLRAYDIAMRNAS